MPETDAERDWRLMVCRRAFWRCEAVDQGKRCIRAAPEHRMIARRVGEAGKCLCAQHAASDKFDQFLTATIKELGGAKRGSFMTPKLQTLAGKLRDVTQSIEQRTEKLVGRLESVDRKHAEADAKAHAEVDKIEEAVRGVEDLVNQMSNGGPPLEGSGGSST